MATSPEVHARAADVRPAQLADAEQVFALLMQFAMSYQPTRDAFDRTFPLLLDDDRAHVIVACLDGEVVGYALALRVLTLYANGPVMEIQELMVDPVRRNQGIGHQLVSAVVARAWEEGCREVTVPTRRAGGYYAKLGFVETATYYKLTRAEWRA